MTTPDPDPGPPPDPAGPDGPAPVPVGDWLDARGGHLLAPIAAPAGGPRSAACPVCATAAPLPPAGGWVEVRCAACGTDFVAHDGVTPPPPPPPLPPPPVAPVADPPRASPLAPPPLGPVDPLPAAPRSFTSEVRTDPDGRRFVTCPLCRGAEVEIDADAEVAVFPRCPACRGSFLVNLGPDRTPAPLLPPAPAPPIHDAEGRLWDYCPRCGLAALIPGRSGAAFVLTCAVCGQQIVVSPGPYPPRPPLLPAPPSVWARLRRWFGRR